MMHLTDPRKSNAHANQFLARSLARTFTRSQRFVLKRSQTTISLSLTYANANMAYIDPQLLNMARAQANAIREKKELPYKAPYKYLTHDKTVHEADAKWFDEFCASLAKDQTVKLPPNEPAKLPQAN